MEFYSDSLHKIAYSTDASAYRVIPRGVAYPDGLDDIPALIRMAREKNTHLIPRAGGTSIAGQVVGDGIVVDISRNWNRILEINPEKKWAIVEPGVVRDELNLALKPHGLFFSPETSTSNRCCIGGMFGNNSCGTHSLVYGSTRHHVLEAKAYLSDGSFETFKSYSLSELEERFGKSFWKKDSDSLIERIYSQLIRWHLDKDVSNLIERSYPDRNLRRRSCGYAIDEAIEILPKSINLCKLLAGSEGTLAFITEIKVSLDPLPPKENMVLCAHCDALDKSFFANIVALKHNPVAVELMDGKILELSKGNVEQDKNRFFVKGDPAAILITEFNGKEMEQNADALEKDLKAQGLSYCCTRVYGNEISKVWALRKAGLGVLSGMKGDAKPIGVIEDTAVSPYRMPEYMADFQSMMKRIGLDCVYYGHISTGELHLRPIINIKEADGKKKFREVAEETAKLVKKHKGSLSGEHGDGILRGEFIPLLYGEETYKLMLELKNCWDPDGIFNKGKIVGTPPMDENLRLGVDQHYAVEKIIGTNGTYFNWRAAFDDCKVQGASGVSSQTHALMCSLEQCNGAGDCRKSNSMGGTMCPVFKLTRDELNATRGRANVLREMLTRGWQSEAFAVNDGGSVLKSDEIKSVLNSCLACKGCRSECPSNFDMTRVRAEILQQMHDQSGIPFRNWMVSHMNAFQKIGSVFPIPYNMIVKNGLTSSMLKKTLHFSSYRSIPTLNKKSFRYLVKQIPQNQPTGKKVFLFADEFTNFQEAELGLMFAELLVRLGYEVSIPDHKESGRAAISKGNLKLAKKLAQCNVEKLKDAVKPDCPFVGIEPSCLLSFRDEYPDLVTPDLRDVAQELGKSCLLFDEFLLNEIESGNIRPESFDEIKETIWLHGHCHQKALVGVEKTASTIRKLLKAKVYVIPSGCCGMAGSYGYEKEHYETSMAIGEMVLFPAVRKARASEADSIILAPGTSCRQQIMDGTGIRALHPIELLYNNLKNKKNVR